MGFWMGKYSRLLFSPARSVTLLYLGMACVLTPYQYLLLLNCPSSFRFEDRSKAQKFFHSLLVEEIGNIQRGRKIESQGIRRRKRRVISLQAVGCFGAATGCNLDINNGVEDELEAKN
ncbi:MAG: hypothetical protein H6635_03165 [Anaerolineales bacterium]|nr:hypothetical protein [Anaerolineales bacterium]